MCYRHRCARCEPSKQFFNLRDAQNKLDWLFEPWEMSQWSWWRHQMETFSPLLAICAGNSPVPGESPPPPPPPPPHTHTHTHTHKGQGRGALMFSLICVGINGLNGWVNNRKAGHLRRHRAHYDIIVMFKSAIFKVIFRIDGSTLVKLLSGEHHSTSLIISQHSFRWWLYAASHQAITCFWTCMPWTRAFELHVNEYIYRYFCRKIVFYLIEIWHM